ncbi:MAG TPA: flavin reductase family protein [Dongiaceae bacterium]|nr:flavin reductase family protein [Dongiaceae bacterium]
MTDFHVYEPRNGHGLKHDPLNSIVAPRPIGWVSTRDAQGRFNLAPYSFFNLFSYRPPIIGFCSNGWKDSVRNAEATREFVWNLATRPLAEQMNMTSASVPAGVSEFALAGLTPEPARLVGVPRVKESPVAFECRVTQIIRLQAADGREIDSWVTFGEAVCIHIRQDLIENGVYNTVLAEPIVRGGGPADYFTIGEAQRFRMTRPG